jgi:hypothetical protein
MVQGKEKVVSYKVHDKVAVPREEWYVKENTHEPTFTNDEYDRLVNLLSRSMRTANGEGQVHLFSGYLRCGDCGKALQRRTAKGHVYYACRTYTEKSREKCSKHTVAEVELKEVILAVLRIQIGMADLSLCGNGKCVQENIDYIVRSTNSDVNKVGDHKALVRVVNTEVDHKTIRGAGIAGGTNCDLFQYLDKRIAEQKKELNKIEELSDGLYIDWKSGEITIDDFRRMKAKFNEQILRIHTVITNLEEEKQQSSQVKSAKTAAFELFLQNKNITKLDRNILTELTEMIYVYEQRRIAIGFNYRDIQAEQTSIKPRYDTGALIH